MHAQTCPIVTASPVNYDPGCHEERPPITYILLTQQFPVSKLSQLKCNLSLFQSRGAELLVSTSTDVCIHSNDSPMLGTATLIVTFTQCHNIAHYISPKELDINCHKLVVDVLPLPPKKPLKTLGTIIELQVVTGVNRTSLASCAEQLTTQSVARD